MIQTLRRILFKHADADVSIKIQFMQKTEENL